jgi:hypothetical protein
MKNKKELSKKVPPHTTLEFLPANYKSPFSYLWRFLQANWQKHRASVFRMCIEAAFDYEESNYKSCERYIGATPRRTYYLSGQLVGVFKLHINFAEFHSDCCFY